jgi:hypothetical protein
MAVRGGLCGQFTGLGWVDWGEDVGSEKSKGGKARGCIGIDLVANGVGEVLVGKMGVEMGWVETREFTLMDLDGMVELTIVIGCCCICKRYDLELQRSGIVLT